MLYLFKTKKKVDNNMRNALTVLVLGKYDVVQESCLWSIRLWAINCLKTVINFTMVWFFF
jgi:hypothetical protein